MVNRVRRKIPRNAVEQLLDTCQKLSDDWETPAAEIFRDFLRLMDKYADYFFAKPWPEKYTYEEATTFTNADIDFLLERKGGFLDRYTAMCLKKNINLEVGFMGYFGMYWTQLAFREKFVRPMFKPVLEAFDSLARKNEDAQTILGELRKQFGPMLIHESLIDLLEHKYACESLRKLIAEIFELLHTKEEILSCKDARCNWYYKQKYSSST